MSINKLTFLEKTSGDTLAALEWNTLTNYVNTVVDEVNNTSNSSSNGSGNFVIPKACYVFLKNSSYVTLSGRTEGEDTEYFIPNEEPNNPNESSILPGDISGNVSVRPTSTSFNKYLVIQNIGATSLGPGGICRYVYSTDLEKFFNISTPSGAYNPMLKARLEWLYDLLRNKQKDFTYNDTEYTILISDDPIDDIVILSPKYAGEVGKQVPSVRLSDLITITNLMINQTGPWSV